MCPIISKSTHRTRFDIRTTSRRWQPWSGSINSESTNPKHKDGISRDPPVRRRASRNTSEFCQSWIHILHLWSSTMLASQEQCSWRRGRCSALNSDRSSPPSWNVIVKKKSYDTSESHESLISDLIQEWESWFYQEQKINMENTSPVNAFHGSSVTKRFQQLHLAVTWLRVQSPRHHK